MKLSHLKGNYALTKPTNNLFKLVLILSMIAYVCGSTDLKRLQDEAVSNYHRKLQIMHNQEHHHVVDASEIMEGKQNKAWVAAKKVKKMNMEVMILIGIIACCGLFLLFTLFCLCLFFFKERKEENKEILELESASYASRTHYSQMPMYQLEHDGFNSGQNSQRSYNPIGNMSTYGTEKTYEQSGKQQDDQSQGRRKKKRSRHGSSQGGQSSQRGSRNRDRSSGSGGPNYNRDDEQQRNQRPPTSPKKNKSYQNEHNGGYGQNQHGYDLNTETPGRYGSNSADLSNQNNSIAGNSGKNSSGRGHSRNESSQEGIPNQRNQFGVIQEEVGEHSQNSESRHNNDNMMFQSQLGDDDNTPQDEKNIQKQRLINQNTVKSDNFDGGRRNNQSNY